VIIRVLTVRVCDSSGKDLLQATKLVDVPLESTFRDVLNDLPGDFADRTLLEVFVREYEGSPDLASLRLCAGFLEKSLAEIDLILQQHRKPCPEHATLSVSLRQAPGPVAPVVQNAFTVLAAAGQAAYCRKKTVQLHEVQCWFQLSTDKGQLAAALQTRLEQVVAGFLSSDKDTLRRLVFTRLVQVFWRVTPQLQKRFESDFSKAGPAVKAAVIEFQDLFGYRQSQQGEDAAHVRSGLYVWQYCKHPPTAKPHASTTAEQAHAAAPSHPAATVAASDDAAAPGMPRLPEWLH
jgi:hypothetical protein